MKTREILSQWDNGTIPRPCILLYIDLCKFATFNRIFGHHASDKLLDEIEHVLRQSLRPDSRVFRWGGDEFLIFIPVSGEELLKVVARLRVTLPVAFHATACPINEHVNLMREIDILDTLMEKTKWAQV